MASTPESRAELRRLHRNAMVAAQDAADINQTSAPRVDKRACRGAAMRATHALRKAVMSQLPALCDEVDILASGLAEARVIITRMAAMITTMDSEHVDEQHRVLAAQLADYAEAEQRRQNELDAMATAKHRAEIEATELRARLEAAELDADNQRQDAAIVRALIREKERLADQRDTARAGADSWRKRAEALLAEKSDA